MSESHLITDDETRRIAEDYLAASSWFGDVTWQKIMVGPSAKYRADVDGNFDENADPGENRWSWGVSFTDPSNQQKQLDHELVLEGIRGLIFGDSKNSLDFLIVAPLKQWFTSPPEERRALALGAARSSRVCQQALYGRKVFDVGDEPKFGDTKLDFFKGQRPQTDDDA